MENASNSITNLLSYSLPTYITACVPGFIFLFHCVIIYVLFIGVLISNNIPTLLLLLILACIIKCSFYFFDRCILSVLEENKDFPFMSISTFAVLNDKLTEKDTEGIIINFGLLMVLNKIFFLLLFPYISSSKK